MHETINKLQKDLLREMPELNKRFSSAEFKSLVNKYFKPRIRNEGWSGSGFHYKKEIDNPYIFLLSLYPGKYGGEISIEIGMHLDFIKNPSNESYDRNKIKSYHADVRRWMHIPDAEDGVTLKYGNSIEKNVAFVETIWESFLTDGKLFFNQFTKFPTPYLNINVSDIKDFNTNKNLQFFPFGTECRQAWYFAQLNEFIGNIDKAKQFALFALSEINGQMGISLKPELTRIAQL